MNCFKGKYKVTSGYQLPDRPAHNGLDVVALEDTNVYAPCDGVIGASGIVTNKADVTWEWGNFVRLDTEDGHSIFMCHMASRAVSKGQKVEKGDKLGVMGYTGHCIPAGPGGTHTHLEIRKYGTRTNVNPSEYTGIPNKVGTYQAEWGRSLSENCAILHKHGIMNTPQYWINTAPRVQYLEELIGNMAEVLEK